MNVLEFGHGIFESVIVDNLDRACVAIIPDKANAPLVIYANAPLAPTFALQSFEAIRRGYAQILKRLGVVEHA